MKKTITIKLERALHDYKKWDIIQLDYWIFKREFSTYWKIVEDIEKNTSFKNNIKKEIITEKTKKVKTKKANKIKKK